LLLNIVTLTSTTFFFIRLYGPSRKDLFSGIRMDCADGSIGSIAWHVEAEAEGGLPESARKHALAIAQEASLRIQLRRRVTDSVHKDATVIEIVSDHDSRLPMAGSVIVKEYRGKTIIIHVLDEGFEYNGRRFASLSAIAKDITGTKWNGFVFFGLAKEQRRGR
jgi:hypothetical protein